MCKVTSADVQALYREVQKNGRKTEHPEYGYALSGSTIRSLHGVFHQAMDAAVGDAEKRQDRAGQILRQVRPQ